MPFSIRRAGFLIPLFLTLAQAQAQTANLPVVSNTAELQALASTSAPAVLRLDAVPGAEAPPQVFVSSSSACPITGGDTGSQVPSSDGKCWIARHGTRGADVRQWGCTGNATADNSACMQAAIDAMQGGTLRISGGLFRVNSPLVSAGQIVIEGDSGGGGIYNSKCATGLRAGTSNVDLLTLRGAGSVVSRLCIDSASRTSTSGAAVVVPAGANSVRLEGNQINGICWAIDVTGGTDTQNAETVISNNTLTISSKSPSCGGIRVGARSTGARTVDLKLSNNAIFCNYRPGIGLLVLDSGGIISEGNVFSFNCGIGTKLFPGKGQAVIWSSFAGSVLGDTDTTSNLVIDTNSKTATLFGNRFSGAWASNPHNGAAVVIQNMAGTKNFSGIDMVHQTIYTRNNLPGVRIKSGTNIRVRDSTICSNGNSAGSAIIYEGDASNVSIQNNRIGQCDNYRGGTLATGITITTNQSNIGLVTGNNFTNTRTPIAWAPTGNADALSFIASDNLGIDNTFSRAIPAAAEITVPVNPIAMISGSGTISSIQPVYQARQITMIVQGIVDFVVGGNICNALTASSSQTVEGVYNSSVGCWLLR